jgi:sarcosine oxidase subunit alpha
MIRYQQNRLPKGGRIDRGQTLHFSFDGESMSGYAGDTLASALLANDVYLVGRSFKYHRPRGIFSAGAEEPNALVQLGEGAYSEPNMKATQVELYDGLTAQSQNRWPSLRYDIGAINSLASRMIPAGFYYKTFMWPASMWMTYEKVIRKTAGLGRSPVRPDPERYEHRHAHCDVLVVGAGPAGLAAALAAGRSGARVIVADEQTEFGGSLLSQHTEIDDLPALNWVDNVRGELAGMDNVTLLPRTTATGYYDYNYLVALERVTDHLPPGSGGNKPRQRLWKIRSRQVVLATGSIERPLVFADNDRPGVMLAAAVRSYITRYSVMPARGFVVFTNNDSAYHTAIEASAGGSLVTVVDIRTQPGGNLVRQAEQANIMVHRGSAITAVRGRTEVRGVEIMRLNAAGDGVVGSSRTTVACNVVATSGGWTPTVHLHSQSRGKLEFNDDIAGFIPAAGASINPHYNAGACNGSFGLNECLEQGFRAGHKAAGEAGFEGSLPTMARATSTAEGPMRILWTIPCEHPIGRGPKKHFHELQNDSTIGDLHLAVREGFSSAEHLKRYTTTGMATDQGKTSNLIALGVLAELRGQPIASIGVTTYRPPYTPLTFGAVAGQNRRELFLQERKTAIHPWHDQNAAVYEDVGDWKRPRYFPRNKENMDQAVQRECRAVRKSAGILDASTLGKIDLQGRDCTWLLNMVYTNAWSKLETGRCRYGLMLNENGMVFDDGVTTRIGEKHYHMTTTTGGAARVLTSLEEWLQTEWPDKEVYCTSVTEQWAVVAISGPAARDLLAELTDIPLDQDSFPFMSMREGGVAGIPARVFRISFTGELAYEINVPAHYGLCLWEQFMKHSDKYDLCPYGTESMHVLRAEMGFIIVGLYCVGSVTPNDLGMDWIV